ncbi:helix-turn-helix transcriptional regulator [Enterobacter bugandensis]|uniref:helix-turn-helix transcriptional regulator n=2 Tax=Enterobacter bugandensis TaxID=881260 RepID=UPI00345C983D
MVGLMNSMRIGCIKFNFYVDDQFFIHGLRACISDVANEIFLLNRCSKNNTQSNFENYQEREINIIKLVRGEERMCNAMICNSLNSMNIMIVDRLIAPRGPSCYRDALVLNSQASIRITKNCIRRVLREPTKISGKRYNCDICKCVRFSEQELKVIYYFCSGMSIRQISRLMKINHKTCYSHKDHVYAKLGIKSAHNLIEIIRKRGAESL